ncbi:LOW QUALITY PROTEIN: iduronate 2-sulfatase-like [Nilaparvata lugens]|uniref:LOW QUALITY PROTEIN: iduronate 2-sulfatase-like n=2 Tax=Nilaparvata lugens TaxID=108931 RepID=UPI00193DEDFB|nr:LOW QUALITY PROTEIN: iduronate 2-sulfatase-like [Nilaparvata lugens]
MILLLKYFSSIVIFGQLFSNVFCVQNILLIVVNDLRPALGCYNDKNAYTTPHIDELAANSYVFTRAFAQQALCAPSRNSFLTSRRPDSLLLYDFYSYWRHVVGNFTTLPQFFKERGYVTKSIGKVFHPGLCYYHPLENVPLPDNRQRPYGSPTVAWNPWNDLRERDDIAKLKLLFPFQPMPVDWMKSIIQSYNAAVTYIDELIGELLLTLENEGLDNNTIVALIGDHGELSLLGSEATQIHSFLNMFCLLQ